MTATGHRPPGVRATVLRRIPRCTVLQPLYQKLHTVALAGMNLDVGSSVEDSGETNSLAYLAHHPNFAGSVPVIFDVGANVGTFAQRAVELLGERMVLHAFEPSAHAFEELRRAVGTLPQICLHRKALAETAGEAPLFSNRPGSEIGSLFTGAFDHWDLDIQHRETVALARLDDTCRDLGVDRISLLKLDVEGGELAVLRGASALIESRSIDLIQFEFGTAAMGPRVFFRDLYDVLNPHYQIHRIVRDGLAPIPRYDTARCEIFTTASNYLAVSRDLDVQRRAPRNRRGRHGSV